MATENKLTRNEVVEFLLANEDVTTEEANDFMDVVEAAEEEESGSSDAMMALVKERMREVRLKTLVEQVATINPEKVSLKHVQAIQRICAQAVED